MTQEFMEAEYEREGWLRYGVAAELAKRYTDDQRDFLQMLVLMLEGALPDETEVERRGSFLSRKKTLHRVVVTLGENRYSIEDPGHGALLTTRTRVVRGIALKTEELPVEEWITELGAALDERARSSQAAREALSRLVG